MTPTDLDALSRLPPQILHIWSSWALATNIDERTGSCCLHLHCFAQQEVVSNRKYQNSRSTTVKTPHCSVCVEQPAVFNQGFVWSYIFHTEAQLLAAKVLFGTVTNFVCFRTAATRVFRREWNHLMGTFTAKQLSRLLFSSILMALQRLEFRRWVCSCSAPWLAYERSRCHSSPDLYSNQRSNVHTSCLFI